jgi:hypothetical protein
VKPFRDKWDTLVAPWLRGDGADEEPSVGRRFMTALLFPLDGFAGAIVQGIGLRYAAGPPPASGMPRTPEALAFVARDRRIVVGRQEPQASTIERCQRYLDDWPRAGNAFALMEQIRGYLTPHAPKLRVINNTGGAWRTLEVDGSSNYLRANPTNWDWSGEPVKHSRCWLIIYVPPELWEPGPVIGDPALWGGAIGTPGYTIGSTATPDQLADLRAIIFEFMSAGSKYEAIVLAFDPDSFDPEAAPGSPGMPDGSWADHVLADGVTPARLETARYVQGY